MQYHDSNTASHPRLLGHRGAPRLRPENTLESLEEALSEGADGVEYDVQLSEDDVPFLFHDLSLLHACGQPGKPWRHPIAYLESLAPHRRFDGESSRARIPRLEQVLERIPGIHDVELKLPDDEPDELRERLAAAVSTLFARARDEGRISPCSAITSFDLPALDLVARLDPDARFGAIVETEAQWNEALRWTPHRNPSVLSIAFPLAARILRPEQRLPAPFASARLWIWNVPETAPNETLPWNPEALIVDDPATRARFHPAV